MSVLWSDTGFWPFFFVTFVIGGATALAAGRAVAATWRPMLQVVPYAAILAAAARFLQYALFDGTFFVSLESPLEGVARWALAYVILIAIAAAGYTVRRTRQMATQYSWLAASGG
jgi:hypothetical protein